MIGLRVAAKRRAPPRARGGEIKFLIAALISQHEELGHIAFPKALDESPLLCRLAPGRGARSKREIVSIVGGAEGVFDLVRRLCSEPVARQRRERQAPN